MPARNKKQAAPNPARQLCLFFVVVLASCAGDSARIELMPAPAVYTETGLPIAEKLYSGRLADSPMEAVFYATDRAPADDMAPGHATYTSLRGGALRLGRATVRPGRDDLTWSDLRGVALLKTSGRNFPIKVGSVTEYGTLPASITAFSPVDRATRESARQAADRYAREINRKLARSRSRQIHIYIHGYKTAFENPILTTAELWHYLGNDGVFITYSWPATPKTLAYFSDAETAHTSSRNLREFIRFLAKETRAERINLLAYSAGTRVLARTLGDLALEADGDRLPIGTVVLLAGDVDQGILAGHLSDGMLDVVDQFIIYQSDADMALKVSRFLTNSSRAGQGVEVEKVPPGTLAFLEDHPRFELVDVSDVDSARRGNGHGYLRSSPWVSGDLLMSLTHHLDPASRGLIRQQGEPPVWRFPKDYPARLRAALLRERPELVR